MNRLPIKLPDGKIVDLDSLPHLLIVGGDKAFGKNFIEATLSAIKGNSHRVISNPRTLEGVRLEMERRLRHMFYACGSTRIEVYNEKAQNRLPYVIILLNDITDYLGNDQDNLFAILAKGRAPGYHVIAQVENRNKLRKLQDITRCFHIFTL